MHELIHGFYYGVALKIASQSFTLLDLEPIRAHEHEPHESATTIGQSFFIQGLAQLGKVPIDQADNMKSVSDDAFNVHHAGRGLFLADKYAEALTRRDLQMMRDVILETGASPNTCNKMQAYLRAILAWGVENEYIRLNPWRDYKRLKEERPQIEVDFQAFQNVYHELPEYWQWAVQAAFFCASGRGAWSFSGCSGRHLIGGVELSAFDRARAEISRRCTRITGTWRGL